MTLREKAEGHLAAIVENSTTGFGWDVVITAPDGFSAPLKALSSDIFQILDPETGLAISGRHVTVQFRIQTFFDLGFTQFPRNIQETTSKPWLVTFSDLQGTSQTFKVNEGNPDKTLGLCSCILEIYQQ